MNIRRIHTCLEAGMGYRTAFYITQERLASFSNPGSKKTYDELCASSGAQEDTSLPVKNCSVSMRATIYHEPLKASEISDVHGPDLQEKGLSIYSQRRTIAATPTPAMNPLLSLSHPVYGLPEQLVKNFFSAGINSIYPWQSRCLLANRLLSGEGNLVYTAPTGGGKSLVADVLMLKMFSVT